MGGVRHETMKLAHLFIPTVCSRPRFVFKKLRDRSRDFAGVENWREFVFSPNEKVDCVVDVSTCVSLIATKEKNSETSKCNQMKRWRFSWGMFFKIELPHADSIRCVFFGAPVLCVFKNRLFCYVIGVDCWCRLRHGCYGVFGYVNPWETELGFFFSHFSCY